MFFGSPHWTSTKFMPETLSWPQAAVTAAGGPLRPSSVEAKTAAEASPHSRV